LLKVEINRTLPGFKLDIAFSVNGEVLGILGPSGSGKTMTLLCIAGLLHPDSGFIQLNDRVLFDSTKKLNLPPKDRNVGFVFQNYALFPIFLPVKILPTAYVTLAGRSEPPRACFN